MSRDEEFSEAFYRLGPGLRRTAFVIVRDWHTAEDVVQQAMVKVYLAWGRVRPETLTAYSRKAVVNEALTVVRRRRPEALRGDITELEPRRPAYPVGALGVAVDLVELRPLSKGKLRRQTRVRDGSDSPPSPAGQDQDEADLATALALLAPRQRAIVALRFMDDLSVDEVASLMGVTTGTVKSQSARALTTLRSYLSPGQSEEKRT